jgi:hypothetical protein
LWVPDHQHHQHHQHPRITITLIFLHWVVGWSMVAGVMVMLLQIPLVTLVARYIRLAQRQLMTIKDQRIKAGWWFGT